MHITWHGQYTVKIQSNSTTIVLDPYSSEVGLSSFRSKADILSLTNPVDKTMSHVDGIQGDYQLIDTPGEYSLSGFTLHATSWHDEAGNERSIQRWHIEGLFLLHVGALNRELTDTELQEIERTSIDILLVPVGGGSGLDTKQAASLVTTIEPRIVIPIHFQVPKLKEKLEPVDQFAKEFGVDPKQREKKLLVKANRMPQDDMMTVILAP